MTSYLQELCVGINKVFVELLELFSVSILSERDSKRALFHLQYKITFNAMVVDDFLHVLYD